MIEADKEDHKLLPCGVLVQSYKNNVIRILSRYQINEKKNQNEEIEVESEYDEEIINTIQEHYVFAVMDASVK